MSAGLERHSNSNNTTATTTTTTTNNNNNNNNNVASPWLLFFDRLVIPKAKRAVYHYIERLSSECTMSYMLDAQLFLQTHR